MLAKQRESPGTLGPPQWAIVTNDAGISFSHEFGGGVGDFVSESGGSGGAWLDYDVDGRLDVFLVNGLPTWGCLLYTSPSPRDRGCSRMPSSA